MKKLGALLVVVLLAMLCCSSVTVRTDFDEQADFSAYHTFALMPVKRHPPHRKAALKNKPDKLVQKRIERAIEHNLLSRGLEQAPPGRSDLLVFYHTGVKNKVDVERYGYHYGRWGRVHRTTVVHRYKEGALVIDLIDRRSKELVWRGIGTGVMAGDSRSSEKISAIVGQILASYPRG